MKIAIAGFGVEGRLLFEHFRKDPANTIDIFDEQKVDAPRAHIGLSMPSGFDVIYKSPGIPPHKLHTDGTTPISSLTNFFFDHVVGTVVGVTGTKGKSTTSALIAHILHHAGRDVELFGNIGIANMDFLANTNKDKIYVYELSSYQCDALTRSPHIAVITNLYQEHLDWHGSVAAYHAAKRKIAAYQSANDVLIVPVGLAVETKGKKVEVPTPTTPFTTKLLGVHNQANIALAHACAQELGVPDTVAREAIASFTPLPYRLERVGTFGNVTFYDDSLATAPEATLAAITALQTAGQSTSAPAAVVDTLILGGLDRGIDFSAFAEALANTSIRNFIVFPESGEKMITEVTDRTIIRVNTMRDAVTAAYKLTNGICLLSNASPSYNLFNDYKDKSAQYRAAIAELQPTT